MKIITGGLMILSLFGLIFSSYAKEQGVLATSLCFTFSILATIWLVIAVDFLD